VRREGRGLGPFSSGHLTIIALMAQLATPTPVCVVVVRAAGDPAVPVDDQAARTGRHECNRNKERV
jgi:hypothetical protein